MIEFVKYFICDCSLFGLIYLIICMIILFLVGITTINYSKGNKKKRISKILLAVILGVFASFILPSIIQNSLSYEIINSFNDKNKLTINIVKPIIYLLFFITALYEGKFLSNKAIKHNFNTKNVKIMLKTLKKK